MVGFAASAFGTIGANCVRVEVDAKGDAVIDASSNVIDELGIILARVVVTPPASDDGEVNAAPLGRRPVYPSVMVRHIDAECIGVVNVHALPTLRGIPGVPPLRPNALFAGKERYGTVLAALIGLPDKALTIFVAPAVLSQPALRPPSFTRLWLLSSIVIRLRAFLCARVSVFYAERRSHGSSRIKGSRTAALLAFDRSRRGLQRREDIGNAQTSVSSPQERRRSCHLRGSHRGARRLRIGACLVGREDALAIGAQILRIIVVRECSLGSTLIKSRHRQAFLEIGWQAQLVRTSSRIQAVSRSANSEHAVVVTQGSYRLLQRAVSLIKGIRIIAQAQIDHFKIRSGTCRNEPSQIVISSDEVGSSASAFLVEHLDREHFGVVGGTCDADAVIRLSANNTSHHGAMADSIAIVGNAAFA